MLRSGVLYQPDLPQGSNMPISGHVESGHWTVLPERGLLTGCASMGPPTIARDRFDYDHAVTTSWKRMMLLNLVKLRYGDTPMFLDVASIINSYTLEAQVNLGATWAASPGWDTGTLGGSSGSARTRRISAWSTGRLPETTRNWPWLPGRSWKS